MPQIAVTISRRGLLWSVNASALADHASLPSGELRTIATPVTTRVPEGQRA